MAPSDNGNVFLTTENLAFSMPLILVCATYAYFKFVPLHIGIPIILAIVIMYQIRSAVKSMKEKRVTNLDEDAIMELVGEEEETTTTNKGNTKSKKAAAVKARLAQEKKGKKKQSAQDDEDDIDDDDLLKFAKKKK